MVLRPTFPFRFALGALAALIVFGPAALQAKSHHQPKAHKAVAGQRGRATRKQAQGAAAKPVATPSGATRAHLGQAKPKPTKSMREEDLPPADAATSARIHLWERRASLAAKRSGPEPAPARTEGIAKLSGADQRLMAGHAHALRQRAQAGQPGAPDASKPQINAPSSGAAAEASTHPAEAQPRAEAPFATGVAQPSDESDAATPRIGHKAKPEGPAASASQPESNATQRSQDMAPSPVPQRDPARDLLEGTTTSDSPPNSGAPMDNAKDAIPALSPAIDPELFSPRGALLMPTALRGTHDILVHQNTVADQEGLLRVKDDEDLLKLRRSRQLVALPVSDEMRVEEQLPANRRFCRPWTETFLVDIGRAHYARFHSALQVNSAVRTVAFQRSLRRVNGNAAPINGETASPHLTGATIDIAKHGLSMAEIAWMRGYLLPLEQEGKLDVEEEFQQPVFHISVYKSYLPPATTKPATLRQRSTLLATGLR